ncbi:MAG: hypothetical protein IAG13_19505 [Deltaproteobacteria bacterium]|nr:hypothetical protein [Nannocystaceae bacterium]
MHAHLNRAAARVDVFATHEPRQRFGGFGWFGGRGGFTQDWLPGVAIAATLGARQRVVAL